MTLSWLLRKQLFESFGVIGLVSLSGRERPDPTEARLLAAPEGIACNWTACRCLFIGFQQICASGL